MLAKRQNNYRNTVALSDLLKRAKASLKLEWQVKMKNRGKNTNVPANKLPFTKGPDKGLVTMLLLHRGDRNM